MYKIAKERGQLAVNFPDRGAIEKCMATIRNNGEDVDELAASGLAYRRASKVDAPVVDECFLNLECEVVWEKELFAGSHHVALCVKVVNVWFDESRYATAYARYGAGGYLYNIHSPMNPESGEIWRGDGDCYGKIERL